MPLSTELQEFIDEIEFDSEDDKATLAALLEKEKLGGAVKSGVMKSKDYTTKTQALADERRKLEADQKAVTDETSRLADWQTRAKAEFEDAMDKVEKSSLRGAALEARLRKLATQYGEDADELMKDILEGRADNPSTPPAQRQQAEADLTKFVTREDFDKAVAQNQSSISSMAMLPVIARDMEREYRRLYGKDYDGSLEELVTTGFSEILARQQRGEKVDFKSYLREKLDFAGQAKRNDEAEKETWKTQTRAEIERDIESKFLAANPTAVRKPDVEEWRGGLSAAARKAKAPTQPNEAQQTASRRQAAHALFEKLDKQHAA